MSDTPKPTPEPIHAITRWSGEPFDELIFCGASSNAAMVNRTMYHATVTCPKCLEVMVRIAKAEGRPTRRSSYDIHYEDH